MLDHHIHSNSKRSWLLNWFSQWSSPHHTPAAASPPAAPPPPPITVVTDNSDRRSDITTSTDGPAFSIATSAGRRSSRQSTVMDYADDDDDEDEDDDDDGQFSSTSSRRRSSNERSVLSDLWSRARRHHPHYPQFHWLPGSSKHHHHRHPHRMSADDPQQERRRQQRREQQQVFAHSVSGTPRQSQEAVHLTIAQHDTDNDPTRRLATSFQENGLYIPTDDSPLSRPVSIYSQQTSILDDDDDDYKSWAAQDTMPAADPPWVIKPELILLIMDNRLFCSPFNDTAAGKQVLHVGPGDSTWAVDVATDYPRWRVVDLITLNSGQPSAKLRYHRRHHHNLKTARCASLVEGIQQLPDASFDLIHCRFLNLALTSEEYGTFLRHLWRVCRPGGFVELLELDMRIYYDRPTPSGVGLTQKFNSGAIRVLERKGLDPRLARHLKDLLSDAGHTSPGFQALLDHKYASLPLGVWGGRIGVMFRDDIRDLFERLQEGDFDDSSFEAQFEQMDYELGSRRAFMNLHFAYAQKVERPEQ